MKATIEINDKIIADAIGDAGIAYWSDYRRCKWNPNTWRLVVYEVEDGPTKRHVLTRKDFARGLALLAVKAPFHYRNLVEESGDMYTGDALVQCACFPELVEETGDLKYG